MFSAVNKIKRSLAAALIFSALIITVRAEETPRPAEGKVRLLILSKHLRIIKERDTEWLRLSLDRAGEIDTGSSRIPCR